uniref:Superoxide dismutase [Cu-Zn] (Trinotate prediction) n=1 Tax=Myxobolus squamalis TaxID=59785 RepID=A0A6B2GBS6_MYXSQ
MCGCYNKFKCRFWDNLVLPRKLQSSQVELRGSLTFTQHRNSLQDIQIHEFGDLTNGCISVGDYYNPYDFYHSFFPNEIKHFTGFGTIEVDSNGKANIDLKFPQTVTLFGDYSIIGRAIVVVENFLITEKVFTNNIKTTDSFNKRLGCAVIGIAKLESYLKLKSNIF